MLVCTGIRYPQGTVLAGFTVIYSFRNSLPLDVAKAGALYLVSLYGLNRTLYNNWVSYAETFYLTVSVNIAL